MRSIVATTVLSLAIIAPLTASQANAKDLKIGVTMSRSAQLFLVKMRAAMEADAPKMNVKLQVEDAQGDVGTQLSQIQNFIANGVDAIIINAADTSATDGMTKAVTAAGLPLVYVNLGPDLGTKLPPRVSVVVSDHIVSGRLEMEGLVKCLGGKGDLGILVGELASNAAMQRTDGNKEVIGKYPGMKVIEEQTANWNRNQAIDLVRNWITKGEKFSGIVANNDEMAIGAIFAMQEAGLDPKKACIGGIDATEDALDQMRRGNLAVTVFQDAKGQGQAALQAAVKMIEGQKVEPYVLIPYELVTPENMKDFAAR